MDTLLNGMGCHSINQSGYLGFMNRGFLAFCILESIAMCFVLWRGMRIERYERRRISRFQGWMGSRSLRVHVLDCTIW